MPYRTLYAVPYLTVSNDVRRHGLISVSYIGQILCHGSALDIPQSDIKSNDCPFWKGVLNPRFQPTILVSLTTSQVLRRPPEET